MNNFLTKLAVTLVDGGTTDIDIPDLSANDVLMNGLNIVYLLAGIIAVIVIIIGGILYATSAGNSGNITKAKGLVTYSVVGLVVVIIAYAVTNFVVGKF